MIKIDIKKYKDIIDKSNKQIENYTKMLKQLDLKIKEYE